MNKTALFGGTFDPIHRGHINLAMEAVRECDLNQLIFLPNYISPFKRDSRVTPGEMRAEMIRRILPLNSAFSISEYELERQEPSYSYDTLSYFRERMPEATLRLGDFRRGLVPALAEREYECIVATYSLHHLTDGEKTAFLRELRGRLRPGGEILVGDVAFETRAELEACRAGAGEAWDEEEVYFVAGELRRDFPGLRFEKLSPCAGVLSLGKE